jgi:protein SCO1
MKLARFVMASLLAFLAFLAAAPPCFARSSIAPQELRSISIEQRIGEKVPGELPFRDESGAAVELERYYGKRPIILALVYNSCPMLCSQVLSGMVAAMRVLKLDAGRDFDALVVSFDPKESSATAAAQKAKYLRRYDRAGAEGGIHFLTGDEEPIRALTSAVGFRYQYDPELGQYAHASAIMVLTPDGRVARYFFGTEYSARDLRLALVEASGGKLGGLSDGLMLLCYRYDPSSGSYSATAVGAVRIGGAVTLGVLAGFIGLSLRRERRRRRGAEA